MTNILQAPPDSDFDAAAKWEGVLRALPLVAGGAGITLTLANRIVSGVRTPRCITLQVFLVLPNQPVHQQARHILPLMAKSSSVCTTLRCG